MWVLRGYSQCDLRILLKGSFDVATCHFSLSANIPCWSESLRLKKLNIGSVIQLPGAYCWPRNLCALTIYVMYNFETEHPWCRLAICSSSHHSVWSHCFSLTPTDAILHSFLPFIFSSLLSDWPLFPHWSSFNKNPLEKVKVWTQFKQKNGEPAGRLQT